MTNSAFAEVMESSLQTFMGQAWAWDKGPHFGSLVTIQAPSRTIFGVVYQIRTGSSDPVRYPFAYQKTHEELMAEQPQIFEFLKTTFVCAALGYQEKDELYHMMLAQPPAIHSFISLAESAASKKFFASTHYLPLLFGMANQIQCIDELLLALLKYQKTLNLLKSDHLNEFVSTYSLLTGNDYRRLKLFLSRAQSLI